MRDYILQKLVALECSINFKHEGHHDNWPIATCPSATVSELMYGVRYFKLSHRACITYVAVTVWIFLLTRAVAESKSSCPTSDLRVSGISPAFAH